MKRIVVFILAALAIASPLFVKNETPVFADATKICIVSKEDNDISQTEKVKNGGQFYYIFTQNFEEAYANFKHVDGLNIYYSKETSQDQLLKKHQVQSYYTSSVEGMKIIYGFTKTYHDFRYVNGKKINIQIAFTENEIVVGFPLILTGY